MQTHRLLAFALAVVASGCIITTDDDDATLTVFNESDYVIEVINLAPVGTRTWGPNLLGGDVLFPDERITLGVDCDFYDARIIDEDDVTCEVYDLDLCLNDAEWVIRNNTCSVFGATGPLAPTSEKTHLPALQPLSNLKQQ